MTAPAPSPAAEPAPADAPAPPAAPPVPAPPANPPAGEPAPVEPAADADTFDRAYVERLRREAADRRTAATAAEQAAATVAAERDTLTEQLTKQQAMLDAILKAAGVKGDEPADPAALAEQLAAEKAQREQERAQLTEQHNRQVRDLTLRAALPAALNKAGANPDLTTAVLTASGVLSQLDPTADTFTTDLESAVASALDAHPQLKVAPVAVRSGTEIAGRSGGTDQISREQLANMTDDQIVAAQKAGQLRSVLGG